MAYSSALAALADPTRRAIYESLRGTARPVGAIAGDFPVSRPAVSQHLRALREAGLVTESRQGTRRLYAVNPQAALELRDYFQSMWQCAMQAYARHVITEEHFHGGKVPALPARDAQRDTAGTTARRTPTVARPSSGRPHSGQRNKRDR